MTFELALKWFAEYAAAWAPTFALILARVAGIFAAAPLLGSSRVPRRVRGLLVLLIALGMAGAVQTPVKLPDDLATLALGLGGEIAFGIAMGMAVSFVFVAAQWAGEIMGQQMGLSIAQAFDPQFGQSSSLIGDLQFMLTLLVFMSPIVNGPAVLLSGVHASFSALPLMSVGLDQPLFDMLAGLFAASTALAVQIAAPMLVTMLVVDVVLGCIGKTMPQLNVLTAGLSLRSLVGMVVLITGVKVTGAVLTESVTTSVDEVRAVYSTARTD